MHGHGPGLPPPHQQYGPQRGQDAVIALRVVFALVPLLSCGFLSWVTMLRIAIVTRAARDWVLFALSAALVILGFALIGTDPVADGGGTRGDIGLALLLATGVAALAYFLYVDLRRPSRPAATDWYAPPVPPQQPQGYGYGYPPQAGTTVPAPPRHSPQPQPRPHQQPLPQPPHTPSPPRIGQVRAELDELSELLRKQETERGHGQEPGR
ncbi:hypothetical protein ABZY31_15380 [Streptomyces sp. NPDC006529]|uniref:hypothetical protein n=1 Tax=Streptomyces sp. NPDC006529 TaxID=3157177 RepID=UPI0033A5306F